MSPMPTGYTHKIYDNVPITFAEFVWSCSRAMGALYRLRDEPGDVPRLAQALDSDAGSSAHHESELGKAEADLLRLESMSPADMGVAMEENRRTRAAEYEAAVRRKADLRARYDAMLSQVRDWTPPTLRHEGFRAFMVQQLEESIKHDCYDPTPPAEPCLDTYRRGVIEHARWTVDYHRKELDKARERDEERRAWILDLDASVPCPRR
jgi:hypothetical protein